MSLDKKLLEVLCCPITKVPVIMLEENELKELNEQIQKGRIKDKGGEKIESPIEEALITEDRQTIYPIQTGIPIMLEDRGIPANQLKDN